MGEGERRAAVEGFAAYLTGLHIRDGKRSLRVLEAETERLGTRVGRSTLGEMLRGDRFPTKDQAMAFARAVSRGHPEVMAEARKKWEAAALAVVARATSQEIREETRPLAVDGASEPTATVDAASREASGSRRGAGGGIRVPGRRGVVVISVAAAVVLAVVLVAVDPFGVKRDDRGPAAHQSSASGAATGSVPGQEAAGDRWSGEAPIAAQASPAPQLCPTVWFDGTPEQFMSRLQPGGAPPQEAVVLDRSFEVTIQGRTQQSVILKDMRIDVTPRPALTGGIVVSMAGGGCGGEVTPRHFDVDLAAKPPKLTPKPGENYGTITPAVSFPYTISLTDPEVFDLDPVMPCPTDCTFTLTLDWVADGKSGTTVLDNHGQGYRSTSTRALPHYQVTLAGGDQSGFQITRAANT